MRVLYVEHGALVSGGQRSLLELLRGLPDSVEAEVACPVAGPLAAALTVEQVPLRPLRGTSGSFRLHPVHTTRMVLDLGRMAWLLRRHAREGAFDVIHANSVRAGLICALGFGPRRRKRKITVVVHVRDSLPASALGAAIRRVLALAADQILAISAHTAEGFKTGDRIGVVHNPVDVERFSPEGMAAALPGGGPLLGLVAQITPWKAQDDAIRMLAAVRRIGIPARLAIVGEAKFVSAATRYDNRAYEAALHALVAELELADSVLLTGEREDIPAILRACDVVLVPSWDEPFGRTVVEAMATATPVIATSVGGPSEIITDGVDGMLLPQREPERWAEALRILLSDENQRAAIGEAARRTAVARFARPIHVDEVLDIYRRLLS